MKRWAVLWALGGACLAPIACGTVQNEGPGTVGSAGSSSAGETESAAPIALEELCPVFIHDVCSYFLQCGDVRFRDAEHCERELPCFGMLELTDAVARGAIDYDASQVGACQQ